MRALPTIFNVVRLCLLTAWWGVALFFGAVVAPAVFTVLRSFDLVNANEIAGSIVTRTLSAVNLSGIVIAVVVLALTLFAQFPQTRLALIVEIVALAIMIAATAIGHFVIAARMRALRAAMVLPIDQVPASDVRRVAFNQLHGYSVNVLGLAMIAVLIAIVFCARDLRK